MTVLANTFDRQWQDCEQDYLAAVKRVGASGWYILGQEVSAFEAALADWCKVPHVIGVANGMDALEIAFRVSGISAGDKVLTTPLSAFATALSILRTGAVPVYCDVDAAGLLDPEAAEHAFEEHPDIRAIAPVHLYGQLSDMDALQALADRHGARVFEDAAQAIGARRGDVGVASGGRMASLSFYPTKNLGVIGDGGALLMHDPDEAEIARSLRNYGQAERYVHTRPGLNSRLDELHAATLTDAFLPRLNGWLDVRRKIARAYLDGITNAAVTPLPCADIAGSGWHLFPVLVAPERRDAFMDFLKSNDVAPGLHYPVLMPDQRAVTDHATPLVVGELTQAHRFAQSEVSLPIHPYLRDDEVAKVIDAVNGWTG